MVYTLIDLCILKNPCIPGINPTWSWYMSFLMCCWILFAKILLRIFASMFLHLCCNTLILTCSFLFCVCCLWWDFLVAQTVKRLSTVRETWVPSLGREDPLEKEMAIHSSTIAYLEEDSWHSMDRLLGWLITIILGKKRT